MQETPTPSQENTEGSSVESGPEINPTIEKNDLSILVSKHGSVDIGIKNLDAFNTPSSLRIFTIQHEDFPAPEAEFSNQSVWENIKLSLPDDEVNLKTFKNTVEEVVNMLFADESQNIEVSFASDNPHFPYAVKCMAEDSLGPAKTAGEDVAKSVKSIFGFNNAQFWE